MHYSSFVLSNLNKQRQEGEFCDVILKVEGQKFHAHRNVLAASSQYFQKMFTIEMKEKFEKVITINDVSVEAVRILLNYIYTGTLTATEDNAIELFYAAELMCISDAKKLLIDSLIKSLSSKSCLLLHKLGVEYAVKDLALNTSKFIAENIEKIVQQDSYLDLSANELESIFESDDLKVEEEKQVYEYILRWINKDVISRKQYFYKLFSQVRLQHVPLKYVVSIIRKNDLVREFPDCRDLVEDVVFSRIYPELIPFQYPRTCYVPDPDSLMLIYSLQTWQGIFRYSDNNIRKQPFDNWEPNIITKDSALAIRHPFATFCGGLDANNKVLDSVVQFDGRCWNSLPSLNTPRCGCTAIYYKSNLFVFGGEKTIIKKEESFVDQENEFNQRLPEDFADDFEMFDKDWITAGKLPTSFSYATASVVDEKIYVIGGYMLNVIPKSRKFFSGKKLFCKEVSNLTIVYNVREKSWENGPSINIARAGAGSAVLDSTIFVVGGYGINCSSVLVAEILNFSSGVWTSIVNPSPVNTYLTRAFCVNEQIYVAGSVDTYFYRYNPSSRTWHKVCTLHDVGAFVVPFSQAYFESFNKKN